MASLIFSMSASLDGFVTDRDGDIGWTPPSDELFRFHLEQVGALGAYVLGRRLYEAMRVWETDPAMRTDADRNAFADVWGALPKVVFSRTLDRVEGNAKLADKPLADEVAAVLEAGNGDVQIGGADLAGQAIEEGLVDELRIFRHPIVVGGGKRHLPAVGDRIALELVETKAFPHGVMFERYRRV